MKKYNKIFSALLLSVLFSGAVFAQDFIVTANDFKSASKDAILVDVYTAASYAKMHVGNAINIPHTELYQAGDIEGLLKEPAELAKIFGSKGLTKDAKIILYDDGSQKYNSRFYWILKYMGATNVHLLHKDMAQFRKARIMLTRKPATAKPATFTADIQSDVFATADEVMAAANSGAMLVDVRPAGEFAGKEKESKGHIKGSINVSYDLFLEENGAYKSKEDIAKLAASKGLSADKPVIVYCTSSVKAAVAFIALKDILGFKDVKVYDGAYNEMIKVHPEMITM